MKKLGKRTKIRLISGRVSFYTTVKAIRSGLGSSANFNTASDLALVALEKLRHNEEIAPSGLSGRWLDIPIQLDIVT